MPPPGDRDVAVGLDQTGGRLNAGLIAHVEFVSRRAPVVSTQSGVRPICTAVEVISIVQPPGGSMLAKNEVRRAVTSMVTLVRPATPWW